MKAVQGGMRIALKYATLILTAGFLLNCVNVQQQDLPEQMLYGDSTGIYATKVPENTQTLNPDNKDLPKDSEPFMNFKVVLKTAPVFNECDDDEGGDKEPDHYDDASYDASHRRYHDERDRRNHDRCDHRERDTLPFDALRLTIGRVEVLTESAGWSVIYDVVVNGYSSDISLEPESESEIFSAILEDGVYKKIKIYFVGSPYGVSSTDKALIYTLNWERHERDHDREYDHHHGNHDNHESDHYNGHRLKIEHFDSVQVKEGYVTTLFLEIEADEIVEYQRHRGFYKVEPEALYSGYEMIAPAPPDKGDKTPEPGTGDKTPSPIPGPKTPSPVK